MKLGGYRLVTAIFFTNSIEVLFTHFRFYYIIIEEIFKIGGQRMEYVNPYLYGMRCISGKWKTTILHHIYTYGRIRFNETKKTLPISEKVLSQQLKELERDGLVRRIQYQVMPLKVEYVLTPIGEELIPALDIIYIWSVRRMHERGVPIDPDAFVVHMDQRYANELKDIMIENGFDPDTQESE